MLRFLTAHGFDHIAALAGWYAYSGELMDATLGVVQEYVAGARDGWELVVDELVRGGDDPRAVRAAPRAGRRSPASCTRVLGSYVTDPDFAPRTRATSALSLITATIDEEIERLFFDLPADDPALAPIAGRGEEIRDRLQLMSHVGVGGRLIRHHGDFHLGQTLRAGGRWVILDFEGEPARSMRERRRKRSPLRDVAGMLRSFAYAASASELLHGVPAPEDWEDRARAAFLEGYFETVDAALLPPGQAGVDSCCRSSSSRRRSTSCATSSTTVPIGWGSRSRASPACWRPAADMSTVQSDLERIVTRDHRAPHAWLGAHPCEDGGVVVRAFRPDAGAVVVRPEGGTPVAAERAAPGGRVRGQAAGRRAAARLRAGGQLPRRVELHAARSLRVPAHARGPRPAPGRRGAPRGAV